MATRILLPQVESISLTPNPVAVETSYEVMAIVTMHSFHYEGTPDFEFPFPYDGDEMSLGEITLVDDGEYIPPYVLNVFEFPFESTEDPRLILSQWIEMGL